MTRPAVAVSPTSAILLLSAAGVSLRLWQYLANSSLFIDEAALARNILDRSFLELMQPLNYAQVAPLGFLLMSKGAVEVFGTSELALRLIPLLSGISAIGVFWRVASRTLTGWTVAYAVGLFALGTPLVYFSSQLKQYSTDMLATVVILWAVLWLQERPSDVRRAAIVAVVGAATVWLSQSAAFVLIGGGLALAISGFISARNWKATSHFRTLGIIAAAWGLSVACAAALAVRNVSPSDRRYLEWYWTAGFMPPERTPADLLWIWHRFTWIFGVFGGLRRTNGGLGYPWSQVFVILTILGYVAFWRRSRATAVMLVVPVLIALTSAALHLYPFTGRVVSFLLPILILVIAAGAEYAIAALRGPLQFMAPLLLAIAVGAPLLAALSALPPERLEHLRPVMAYVAERKQPDDPVYVYYASAQSFLYYAPRFRIDLNRVSLGRCSVAEPRLYLRDVDRFRGSRRVWIVATHARGAASELLAIVRYLDTIGFRLDSIEVSASSNLPLHGAYAYLFDLSDPARLVSASADTYTVPPDVTDEGAKQWGCYGNVSASGGL